jgi:DNA-binding transcriptional ArsR family regulator
VSTPTPAVDRTGANDVYRAIADPTRRSILELVARDERAVGELAAAFPISQPAVSQHLRVLREAGLIADRRVGRRRVYRARPQALAEVRDWLAHYERFWTARLDALGAHLDRSVGR